MESLTQETFQKHVIEEKQNCLILFVKEGCPICQEMHPLLEEVEQAYQDTPFRFYVIDAVAEEPFYKSLKLQGTPTTMFYRDGILQQKFTGMREFEEVEFLVDRAIAGK